MNPEAHKGKKIIAAILFVQLFASLGLPVFIKSFGIKEVDIPSQGASVVIAVFLCYFVYRGNKWAKYILTACMAISAAGAGFAIFLTLPFKPLTVLMILLFVMYGVMADQLLLSKPVKAYFEYRNPQKQLKNH